MSNRGDGLPNDTSSSDKTSAGLKRRDLLGAVEYPPMQKGASFNLEAVKAQVEKAIAAHAK